jgi:hypothetical protein
VALRDTLSQLYVLRKTLGNTPLPVRVTETQLYVLRKTLGNTPLPVRVTESQLYVLRQTLGQSNRLPIRNTSLNITLLRTASMPSSPPFRVSQANAGVVQLLGLRVTQISGAIIMKLATPVAKVRPILGPLTTVTVTIPAGSALSDAILMEPTELLVGVFIPSPWTDADLGFDVTLDGVSYAPAKAEASDGSFQYVHLKAEAGKYTVFDPMKIPAIRWFKFRSMDSAGASVNQTGQRTLRVVKVRIA